MFIHGVFYRMAAIKNILESRDERWILHRVSVFIPAFGHSISGGVLVGG